MDYGTSDTWEYRKGYDDGARDSQCLLGCVMHFVDKVVFKELYSDIAEQIKKRRKK